MDLAYHLKDTLRQLAKIYDVFLIPKFGSVLWDKQTMMILPFLLIYTDILK